MGKNKRNLTTYSPPHKSDKSRSRPDRKTHVTKASYDSSGKATRTHHYKGSSEYSTGEAFHGKSSGK